MCFSLDWFRDLLIWIIVISAIVGILKLAVPFVMKKLGTAASEGAGVAMSAVDIIIWAVIAIAVVYFCFALISCLLSHTGGGVPLFPRH